MREMLCDMLKQSITVASWGITNVQFNNGTLSMNVDAMKYKGNVTINTAQRDSIRISIGQYNLICGIEEVVEQIDAKIESTDDYEKDIATWLFNS